VVGANGSGPLGGPAWPAPRLPAGYETYRRMRRDPTIALARALAVAPVVAGKWTVQSDADVPQEVRGWIDKQFLTVREPLLEIILKHGYVDFGHQGFELIWGLDAGGRQHVVRFKPLLPDITEILIDDRGGLAGLRQKDVELTGTSAMLVSFGGEGSNLYGEPLLENVRQAWNDWRKANEVAARYDRKIAGAYLLLHYPSFGQGIDQNGAKLDNVYLAQRILDKLEAASGVAIGDVPSELAPGQDPNQTAWRLEVQGSASGQQQGFVDRLRYLDSLKVRGMLLPERAILEGQHGTLAESQSQGDLALLQAELVHHHLTREINRQAVDPVLEANWGPAYRGKVRLEAAPLSDANQGFLRQLVTQVLADPKDFADLFRRADWPAIFDAVGLPQTKASAAAPSGPSAILSVVGRLQCEATVGGEGPNWWPSHPQRCSTAGSRTNDLAVQPQEVHIEGAADDALGLANFSPNQPRDKYGRWTKDGSGASDVTGAAGETGAPGEAATPDESTRSKGPGGPAGSNAAGLLPGEYTWTSADGKFQTAAKLVSVRSDGSAVTLNINGVPKEVSVNKLSASDQELVKGLLAIPANVKIAPTGKGNAFNGAVIRDFAKLAATSTGAQILKQLASVAQSQVTHLAGQKVTMTPFNTDPVTIKPSEGDNHTKSTPPVASGRPSTNVTLYYDPDKKEGDPVVGGGSKRRPAYVGLAKELHVAFQALAGYGRTTMEMEQASRVEENKLRDEIDLPAAQIPR
jgi:hypothetical protein